MRAVELLMEAKRSELCCGADIPFIQAGFDIVTAQDPEIQNILESLL